jgi:preprotein translocase subunit SecD
LIEKRLTLGLDLKGGVQLELRVNVEEALRGADSQVTRDEIVAQAKQAVDRRVNELGVVEPLILVQGAHRRFRAASGLRGCRTREKDARTTALLEWSSSMPDRPRRATSCLNACARGRRSAAAERSEAQPVHALYRCVARWN